MIGVTLNQSCTLPHIYGGDILPHKESFKTSKLSLNLKSDAVSRITGLIGWAYRLDRLTGFIRLVLPH
jgi:hypothetical protein